MKAVNICMDRERYDQSALEDTEKRIFITIDQPINLLKQENNAP